MNNDELNNLRKSMGTLPSQEPKVHTDFIRGCEKLTVDIIDYPKNPYKAIVAAATATWGDNNYENKWEKLTPENRFRVVLASLTGNTLPQALEGFSFTFKIAGIPRHCFDQHARARVGAAFYSIGSRDNNKNDADIILYTKLYDKMQKDEVFGEDVYKHFEEMKRLYSRIIEDRGSWQIARALLPMSYHHPYHFSCNYLSLQGQCNNRLKFCEEEFIVGMHWLIRERIKEKFPLLADHLRPGCDRSKSCQYSKSYELSNVFGCLFAGCGRWKSGTEYATFNESCTDIEELEKQLKIHINRPTEWENLSSDDYSKLNELDKRLFEEK